MKKQSIIILFIAPIFIMAKCSTASVTCTNIDKFESRSGVINTPFFTLGNVVILDTTQRVGNILGVLNVSDNDFTVSEKSDTFSILTKTDFSIEFSGKIEGNTQAEASAKTAINNSSSLKLNNRFRQTLNDPLKMVNNDNLKESMIEALKSNPGTIIMVVGALVIAEKTNLVLSMGNQTAVSANVLKVGNFDVKVNYNCQAAIDDIASQGSGILFKGSFYQLSQNKDKLEVLVFTDSLTEYNLNAAR